MNSNRIFPVFFIIVVVMVQPVLALGENKEQPMAIKEDAGKLYVGYDSGKIRVFDSATLELLGTFTAERDFIFSIETDNDNVYYGTDYSNASTAVTASMTKDGHLTAAENNNDFVLAMTIDSGKLYTCQRSGEMKVHSLPDLTLLGLMNNSGLCWSITTDDKYVYAAVGNQTYVQDKSTLKEITEINAHKGVIRSVHVDEDNIYTVSDDNTLKIWNKTDFSLEKTMAVQAPFRLAGSDNFLYVTSREKILVLNRTGEMVATLNSDGSEVFDMYLSGKLLYATHKDGTVRIWDTSSMQNTRTSQVFTHESQQWALFDIVTDMFYVLLVIGVVGFAATTLYERKKKKKAVSAAATPTQSPVTPATPSVPQQ